MPCGCYEFKSDQLATERSLGHTGPLHADPSRRAAERAVGNRYVQTTFGVHATFARTRILVVTFNGIPAALVRIWCARANVT